MAFSLRLPSTLDRQARAKADQLGLPLNGLICIALDSYLNGGFFAPRLGSSPVDEGKPIAWANHGGPPLMPSQAVRVHTPTPAAIVPLSQPPDGASKAQRRAFTENQRLLRKAGL